MTSTTTERSRAGAVPDTAATAGAVEPVENTYDISEETGNEWQVVRATSAAAALRAYFDLGDGDPVGQQLEGYDNQVQAETTGGSEWIVTDFGGGDDEAYLIVGDTADDDYSHRFEARSTDERPNVAHRSTDLEPSIDVFVVGDEHVVEEVTATSATDALRKHLGINDESWAHLIEGWETPWYEVCERYDSSSHAEVNGGDLCWVTDVSHGDDFARIVARVGLPDREGFTGQPLVVTAHRA